MRERDSSYYQYSTLCKLDDARRFESISLHDAMDDRWWWEKAPRCDRNKGRKYSLSGTQESSYNKNGNLSLCCFRSAGRWSESLEERYKQKSRLWPAEQSMGPGTRRLLWRP